MMLQLKSALHHFFLLLTLFALTSPVLSVSLKKRGGDSNLKNVPGILVTSPVCGHQYQFGDEIEIGIYPHPSVKEIAEVNLQISAETTVFVFAKNVKLTPPGKDYYALKYKLPNKGATNLTDDARYQIGIFDSDGQFISASGTFKIGNPKFGLTISSPPVNQTYQPGSKIHITWKDEYNLYKAIKGIIHLFYYNQKNEVNEEPLDLLVGYELSKGEATVTVPKNLPNHRNYVIVIGFNRTSDIEGKSKVVLEHYIANTFNIVAK